MYTVCVSDHMLVAHSLRGEVFGPAQRLHGATYVVDVELRRRALDSTGVVVDIGLAAQSLRAIIGELHYRNLDDQPDFAGQNTTTEYLARFIFDRMAARLEAGTLGEEAAGIESIKVTLRESPVAWAAYEGQVGKAASVNESERGR